MLQVFFIFKTALFFIHIVNLFERIDNAVYVIRVDSNSALNSRGNSDILANYDSKITDILGANVLQSNVFIHRLAIK